MNMPKAPALFLLLLLATPLLTAQDWLSIGIKGGVPLTGPLENRTLNQVYVFNSEFFSFTESQITTISGGARTILIGPTIEVRLPLGLSVEADALYRQVHLSSLNTTNDIYLFGEESFPTYGLSSRFNLWEFPVLAKYRLPVPLIKPYLEAGPSFRAVSASFADRISPYGITAGIGVETHLGPIRISPEVRFTHWGDDPANSNPHSASYPNQVEVLTGFALPSTRPPAPVPPSGLSKYLSLGVKGGFPFTDAFLTDNYTALARPNSIASYQSHYASRGYLVGPSIEIRLPLNLSLEADALYRPMQLAASSGLAGLLLGQLPSLTTTHAWEFPITGKYHFHSRPASPYLETGAAFRTVSSLGQYLSPAGVVAGLGIEARVLHIRVAPEVRFIHWGKDAPDTSFSRRNQAEFLLGLSY